MSKKFFFILISFYVTQYLGLGFFSEALISILRKNGQELENLSLIYMIGLLFVLRFLWAPIIDKINLKQIGHYKFWIMLSQVMMSLAIFSCFYLKVTIDIKLIILLAFIFTFFSATQDIALDALMIKTLDEKTKPLGNAIKTSGTLLGTILGAGLGLILYENFSWKITLLVFALITFLPILQIVFFKEKVKEAVKKEEMLGLKGIKNYLFNKKRRVWFLFLFLYPAAISATHALISPILVDNKWSLDDIGFLVHVVGYGSGVLVAFFSSYLIVKFGKKKILSIAILGQILGTLSLLFILNGFTDKIIVIFFILIIFSFYTPSSIAILTIMMEQLNTKTPATEFALQHTISMFSGIFFSSLSLYFSGVFGYKLVIIFCSLIALIAFFMSFNLEKFLVKGVVDERN